MTPRRFPLSRFLADESGHTAIEYTMIIAFIVLGVLVALPLIGETVAGFFASVLTGFAPTKSS